MRIASTSNEATISHVELAKYLTIYAKCNKSVTLWGPPGVGKSYAVKAFAKAQAKLKGLEFVDFNEATTEKKMALFCDDKTLKASYVFIDIRLSQWPDTSEIKMPSLKQLHEGVMAWNFSLPFVIMSKANANGCMFFDELGNATPQILAACQQLFHDRAIGDLSLSKGCFLMAASNRATDKANVMETSDPVNNRFRHINIAIPSVKDWLEGFGYSYGIDQRVISYLQWDPSKLYRTDEQIQNWVGPAFPTHRTWTDVSDCINGESDDVAVQIVAQTVGGAISHHFRGFLEVVNKADADKALADPKTYIDSLKDNTQLLYGSIAALIGRLQGDKKLLPKVLAYVVALVECKKTDWAATMFTQVRHSKDYHDMTVAQFCSQIKSKYPEDWKKMLPLTKMIVDTVIDW